MRGFLLPLYDSSSAVLSFQLHPVFAADSNRVPPSNTMSCFIGFRGKSWDNFENFFQTQGFEFLFLSQRTRRAAFWGSVALKTPVLKLNLPLARKPPAAIASESTRAACGTIRKPPGRRLSPSASKVSSLGWLAHEPNCFNHSGRNRDISDTRRNNDDRKGDFSWRRANWAS